MYERPFTRKIIEELDYFRNLEPEQGFGRSEWTAGVKNALLRAGRNFGLSSQRKHRSRPSAGGIATGVQGSGFWGMAVRCLHLRRGREQALVHAGGRGMRMGQQTIHQGGLRETVGSPCRPQGSWSTKTVTLMPIRCANGVNLHEGSQAGDSYLLVATPRHGRNTAAPAISPHLRVAVRYSGEHRAKIAAQVAAPTLRAAGWLCCKLGEGAMRDQGASCSPYDSALARRSCSHAMASVRAHGPRPKARSTIRASPTMPPWRANIPAWPLRSARITSKPLIVA